MNHMEARPDGGAQLLDYYFLLRSRWRMLAACTAAAGALTFVVTRFLMIPYYRATALLRPVAEQNSLSRLQGMPAETVGVLGGMLGGLGAGGERAQEYVAILRSYQFTMAIVDSRGLATAIDPPVLPFLDGAMGGVKMTQWQLYKIMRKRFDCEYDRLNGNLTVHFLAPDPERARRILGLYIDDLRDKLRRSEVRSADAAIRSLSDEARSSPDTLLQAQLYDLIARQIQRKKLAQVEADFAFKVIDPPVVPDKPYSPRVMLDSALSALLTFFALALGLIATTPLGRLRRDQLQRDFRGTHN